MAGIVIPSESTPLTWPAHIERTKERRTSLFRYKTVARGLSAVNAELRRLKAVNAVISTNLPSRLDGHPSVRDRDVEDVGVAVYWALPDTNGMLVPYCVPCDRWKTVGENLLAIAGTLKALRDVERWGAIRIEQAFAGVRALPPGGDQPPIDWRVVLGNGSSWPELPNEDLLALARARHRRAIQLAHPDTGGDTQRAAQLNDALAAAVKELAP